MRRLAYGIGAAVLVTAAAVPCAHADTTYRYWSYWVGGDSWVYSSRGPGFRIPPDQGVEGYRFVVSPKDGSQATAPSQPSTYAQLCPGQPAPPKGQKRVAVVIDFGAVGIAPVGETPPATVVQCVTSPATANGLQVVQQVAPLRFHTSGLICGIAGFPAKECPGQSATSASPRPTASPTPTPITTASAVAPAAPVAPAPVTVPSTNTAQSVQPSASPTPTAASSVGPTDMPSPVAMTVETPPTAQQTKTPAWIAAIGATMIAALLGLAVLARRGRE